MGKYGDKCAKSPRLARLTRVGNGGNDGKRRKMAGMAGMDVIWTRIWVKMYIRGVVLMAHLT